MDEQDEDLSQSTFEGQNNSIHLIQFEKNAKSLYYDRCAVKIKNHKIYVTPHGQDANRFKKTIHANFIRFKNVICFFGSINGFALIFDHKRHCKHVYDILEQKKLDSGNSNSQLTMASFEKRFMVPMIQELRNYTKLDFDFRIFVLKLFKSLDVEQKQRLAPVLIATKIKQCLLDSVMKGIELPVNIEEETKEDPGLVIQDESMEVQKKNDKRKQKFSRSLPSSSSRVASKINKSVNGDVDEACSPPAAKKSRLSLNSSNLSNASPEPISTPFQVLDYSQCGVTKTHLFIFTSQERNYYHDYYWATYDKCFRCVVNGCRKKGPVIQEDSDEIEQIYFKHPRCSCEPRLFDPDRFKSDIDLYQPDYKIVDEIYHGKVVSRLYVYASEDKKKAYKFSYEKLNDRYLCIKCRSKHYTVRAVICKNENDEKFIAVQDREHVCLPIDC